MSDTVEVPPTPIQPVMPLSIKAGGPSYTSASHYLWERASHTWSVCSDGPDPLFSVLLPQPSLIFPQLFLFSNFISVWLWLLFVSQFLDTCWFSKHLNLNVPPRVRAPGGRQTPPLSLVASELPRPSPFPPVPSCQETASNPCSFDYEEKLGTGLASAG